MGFALGLLGRVQVARGGDLLRDGEALAGLAVRGDDGLVVRVIRCLCGVALGVACAQLGEIPVDVKVSGLGSKA